MSLLKITTIIKMQGYHEYNNLLWRRIGIEKLENKISDLLETQEEMKKGERLLSQKIKL